MSGKVLAQYCWVCERFEAAASYGARQRDFIDDLPIVRRSRFRTARNVVSTAVLEYVFGATAFVAIFSMHRNENVTGPNFFFVAFGFEFRDTQPDQRSENAAREATNCSTAQRSDDRACGDERTYAGN